MLYSAPKTLEEAASCLATDQYKILAGGTDFFPTLRDQNSNSNILDLSQVSSLRSILHKDGVWSIGASTTWTDIVRADLPPAFHGLQMAARDIGSIQIQNAGTIGGNICNASPAADSVPPLLTLDASVELMSIRGVRVLPLSAFILGVRKTALAADEFVSAILVSDSKGLSSFSKLGARRYLVISVAMVAALVEISPDNRIKASRIAVGACSAVAQRLTLLERDLVSVNLSEQSLQSALRPEHFAPLSPIDDIRSDIAYRQEAAKELVIRTILSCKPKITGAEV